MKKNNVLTVMALSLMLLGWSSCGSNEEGDKEVPVALTTAEQQKAKLQEISTTLGNKIKVADFKNVNDVLNSLNDTRTENLKAWFDDCIDAIVKMKRVATFASLPEYQDYTAIYKASNFTGHFKLVDNQWVKETGNFNDLQFTFTDRNGKTCLAKISTSGKETSVKHEVLNNTERPFYNWNYNEDTGEYTKTVRESGRRYDNTWVVPENVEVLIQQGNTPLLNVKVNLKLSGGTLTSTTNALVKTYVKINNYEIDVTRAFADVSKGADADVKIKLNGEVILTAHANGKGTYNDTDKKGTAGEVEGYCDIMNQLQIRIASKDSETYHNLLAKVGRREYNTKGKVDALLKDANPLTNIALHYDNNPTPSAHIYMQSVIDYEYSYTSETGNLIQYRDWGYEPVIKFADETTYTFEDYFTKVQFKKVVDLVNDLVRDFEKEFER